jgi:hypothetical protein
MAFTAGEWELTHKCIHKEFCTDVYSLLRCMFDKTKYFHIW